MALSTSTPNLSLISRYRCSPRPTWQTFQNLQPCRLRVAQSSRRLAVLAYQVRPSECLGLTVASGAGKLTLMPVRYCYCSARSGAVCAAGVDAAHAEPRDFDDLRRKTLGHVRQFCGVFHVSRHLKSFASPLGHWGKRVRPPKHGQRSN